MKRIKNSIICWFSINFWNIHTEKDSINPIPDHFNEYQCKRCKMIYKL
jgi:hypothetical protein